ncbi:MAG: Glycosyltransferase [Candidatus Uhrbacteria bacterium GW2011_GWC2_53_7]|uniref:Glycosyltransferase n=1 Tax=Candidatus Uhrbacteria bacterium GW2011_GWC2_53_7 TaxID=1618986 RepID=A0A0G2AVW5_9BACT|nr:MAG: Glycosyltransferase [Parcubacteria group bacterium GW2011_GWA2_53_21]KKW37054.1 MAG: Glycosyltransferase [Candidatus Uhrbacteria bacterium GW2011_GWC2_53_7]
MKLLLLTNLFIPFTRGGAERIVELQANLLAEAGHEVLIVTPTPDPRFLESVLESGARVIRFRPRNLYFILNDFVQPFLKRALWHLIDLYHPYPKRLVRRVITSEKPDLVITHNMKGFGLRAFEAIRETGVPHVHVLHDLQLVIPSGLKIYGEENDWRTSSHLQRLYARTTARRLGSPDLVVSPSQYLLEEYRQAGFFLGSTTHVLPNPAPWAKLGSGRDTGFLEKNPVSRPDPIVLYVGQLEEHKGLRVLMEAWHAVDANLGIVGSGELESEVETFTKERSGITFYGRRSPIEVRSLMARARLLVVPSLCYENAPTVIMEALSLGTPVVASNIGGIPELIREGEGVLVEPGNAEALREAITAELKKPLDREKIKQSATRFSLEVYKRQLEDIIGMVRTNDVKK